MAHYAAAFHLLTAASSAVDATGIFADRFFIWAQCRPILRAE